MYRKFDIVSKINKIDIVFFLIKPGIGWKKMGKTR